MITSDIARGGFAVPAGASSGDVGWVSNTTSAASYLNAVSPMGPTGARSVTVVPARKLKLVAKSLGDVPFYENTGEDILSLFTVRNGSERFVYCTRFAAAEITYAASKIVARNGLPTPCP